MTLGSRRHFNYQSSKEGGVIMLYVLPILLFLAVLVGGLPGSLRE